MRWRGRELQRPADPGRELLTADPDVRRHLRRVRLAAVPLALLAVAQGYGLAAMIVALAQDGRFASVAATVFAAAAILRGLLTWQLERSGRRAAAAAIGRLRSQLATDAAALAAAAPGRLRAGEVAADLVQQLPAIESYVGRFLSAGPVAATTTVVVLLAVAWTDLLSAFLLAPTVPILIVFLWLVGASAGDEANRRLASLQLLGAHLLDVLRGLIDLRAHGRAEFQRSQVRAAAQRYREETMQTLRSAFLSGLVLELVAMLGTALVAVFGGVRLAEGHAELAVILPALVLAPELYLPLRRMGAGYHEAADARAALGRLREVAEAAAVAPVAGTQGGPAAPPPAAAALRLASVRVAGGERGDRIADVSLELGAGEITALVGPSGAGKSTVAHLLLGLLAPTEGRVLAGDVDLATVDLASWRARCAWVPQDPVLLPASLADNARLAAAGASDEEVRRALTASGLGALLEDLPAGLQTQLGEGGARLSSGELRRLAFARAILAGAELLVLDEPTAQLDARSAEHLLATLRELAIGRTVVVITHDDHVAQLADQVVTLAAGRVAAVERRRVRAVPAGGCGHRVAAAQAGAAGGEAQAIAPQPAGAAAVPVAAHPRKRLSLRTALRLVAPPRGHEVWRNVGYAVGLGMLSSIAAVGVLACSGALIVQAATMPPVLSLTAVIVFVRMFSILRATTRYGERLYGHDAALRILESVRVRVFAHVARHVPGRWSDRSAQAFDRAVGDVDRAADLLVRVVVPGAAAIAAVIVAALAALVLSPTIALVIAAGCGALGVASFALARAAGRQLADAEPRRAELALEVFTALQAGPELALSGRTAERRERIAAAGDALEQAAAVHGARTALAGAGVAAGAALLAVLAAALLAPTVDDGALSGALAAGLVLGVLATAERLDGLTEAGLALPAATAAVERLAPALLDVDADDGAPAPRANGSWLGGAPVLRAHELELRRGGRPVLRGASLEVRPGEVLAVGGESGAGKSTLMLALAGLLEPQGGSVRLGAAQLRSLSDAQRSRQVLLVPSAPHLFGGTLAANLRLAAPDASDERLQAALTAVGLGPWLAELPAGLDTVLGDEGVTASGGQRQRLGLARAWLAPARLVLLDEPASHLPEAAALAALGAVLAARPGRGAVLVSHRAAERGLAAREVLLQRGQIIEPSSAASRAHVAAR